ncbi:uncharacterized protein SCHCODRAFT_02626097 [Schizophyllum commune H4-8]|nr:uncharacterized protein SCHCODRAFT_02626097 [Schizophyllum commune H4-8]KAI5892407.1 hypothetical protein SCHCODRAFT_02626097 [Schizophyllum commune H4-8]
MQFLVVISASLALGFLFATAAPVVVRGTDLTATAASDALTARQDECTKPENDRMKGSSGDKGDEGHLQACF